MMRCVVVILASQGSEKVEAATRDVEAIVGMNFLMADGSLGYAAAVLKAFAEAATAGFTHAVTLDVDRNHAVADLSSILAASKENPDAIISGARQLEPGRLPVGVTMARANCDLWVWSAAGHWVTDSPHGNRAYPLVAISEIVLRSTGIEFDVEVLVKAMWAGVKVVQVPVRIDDGQPGASALMSPAQFFRFGALTGSILLQRFLLPTPLLASMHRRPFGELPLLQRVSRITRDAIQHHCDHPANFAASIGLGVFFGIAPVWGFQMILGATVAHFLRLSKAMVLAASNISFPITIPFILYASLVIGHGLHRGEWTGLPRPDELNHAVLLRYLGEYVFGSLVLATAAGAVTAVFTYVAALLVRSLQRRPT